MKPAASTSSPLAGAGLLAALGASLCCITPLLAILGGLGGMASAFAWLEPLRPYLVAITVGVLGFAWFQQLKPAPIPATDDCGCAPPANAAGWKSRRFLSLVTAGALLLLAFPYYSARLYPAAAPRATPPTASTGQPAAAWQTTSYRISGMSCEACARHIEHDVQLLTGVQSVQVSYAQQTAQIRFNAAQTTAAQIRHTIDATGYQALPAH